MESNHQPCYRDIFRLNGRYSWLNGIIFPVNGRMHKTQDLSSSNLYFDIKQTSVKRISCILRQSFRARHRKQHLCATCHSWFFNGYSM